MNRRKALGMLASLLLGLAYTSCLFQWLWVLIVGLPPLIKSGALDGLVSMPQQPVVEQTSNQTDLPPIVLLLVGIFTLIILAISIAVLIRLPRTISKTGQHAVQQAAQVIIPTITHHKTLPARKQRELSRKITFSIQILLVILPFLVSFLLPPLDELNRLVVTTVAAVLFGVSLVCFMLAQLLQPVRSTSRTRSHASRG